MTRIPPATIKIAAKKVFKVTFSCFFRKTILRITTHRGVILLNGKTMVRSPKENALHKNPEAARLKRAAIVKSLKLL